MFLYLNFNYLESTPPTFLAALYKTAKKVGGVIIIDFITTLSEHEKHVLLL